MNPVPTMMHSRRQLIKDIEYEWLADSYNQTKQHTVEYQIILTMNLSQKSENKGLSMALSFSLVAASTLT
jgi:hypothetical protein